MISSIRGIDRLLGPLLAGILLATSVSVPLLDWNPASATPLVETDHHPATCHVGHDHRICIVVGASAWLDASDQEGPPSRQDHLHRGDVPTTLRPPFSRSFGTHRSRAPPVG